MAQMRLIADLLDELQDMEDRVSLLRRETSELDCAAARLRAALARELFPRVVGPDGGGVYRFRCGNTLWECRNPHVNTCSFTPIPDAVDLSDKSVALTEAK